MRQLICRRTCEWLEMGYTYRAVRISYLVRLAEVAHIHIGYCKITTCYRARPYKRAQRCSVSSNIIVVSTEGPEKFANTHSTCTQYINTLADDHPLLLITAITTTGSRARKKQPGTGGTHCKKSGISCSF